MISRELWASVAALVICLLAGCADQPGKLAGRVDDQGLQTGRPRLFFRDKDWSGGLSVAQLRQRAATQPFADRVRLLHTTRANLALKWLITGDEKAAADCLAKLKNFNTSLSTSDEGEELVDVALGYDWLYTWPGFSAADKRGVEAKMVKLADEMVDSLVGKGGHVYHTRMYAWAAGVGMAGLALHDVNPNWRRLFNFAVAYYEKQLLPARKLQGGAIHNGLSYGPNYMMHPLIQFLEAAKSGASLDYFHTPDPADSDWLRDMAYFLIYCVRPDMEHVKYADHATEDPAKHFRFMLDIFAAEYNNGYAAELARRISERFKTSGYHAEWINMFFAFHNPAVKPAPLDELPTFRVFSPLGVGHVFWRSDWTADATMLHFRCGDYFEDHGHFDQGSFTLFKRGDLALQAGGYWGFDTQHRHHYYKQAIAANTVIFNDPADPKDEGQQRNMHYQEARTFADYLAHKKPGARPCVETGDIIAVDDPKWVTLEPARTSEPAGPPARTSEPAGPPARTTRPEDGRAHTEDGRAHTEDGRAHTEDGRARGFHSFVANVTAAWDPAKVKRFVRRVAIVDNKHVVIVDDIEVTKPSIRARWLMHTQREPSPPARINEDTPRQGPATYLAQLEDSLLVAQFLLPIDPKVTAIGGPGHECEVNGVNYTYLKEDKFIKYNKSGKLIPSEGLWRIEVEDPKAETKRLFVTVLTADDLPGAAPTGQARFDGDDLIVKIGGSSVRFIKVQR